MKSLYILCLLSIIFHSCAGQQKFIKMEQKIIINKEILKKTSWHTGFKRDDNPVTQGDKTNYFSDDIFIHFLENDSVEITYKQYSPSIGEQTTFSKGTYQVASDDELVLDLIEPTGHTVSIRGKSIPYHLNMFNNAMGEHKFSSKYLSEMPKFKTYRLLIKKPLSDEAFTVRLELTYLDGQIVPFGDYKFDTKKED